MEAELEGQLDRARQSPLAGPVFDLDVVIKSIPAKAGTHGENGHGPLPVWRNISTAGPRSRFSAALSLTDAAGQHHKITVRILHENLLLTGLAVACFAPNFTGTEVIWPISGSEISED
jgi:hypothetical protein